MKWDEGDFTAQTAKLTPAFAPLCYNDQVDRTTKPARA